MERINKILLLSATTYFACLLQSRECTLSFRIFVFGCYKTDYFRRHISTNVKHLPIYIKFEDTIIIFFVLKNGLFTIVNPMRLRHEFEISMVVSHLSYPSYGAPILHGRNIEVGILREQVY